MNRPYNTRLIFLPHQNRTPAPQSQAGWLASGSDRIQRPKAAMEMLGISKATLYRMISGIQTFPKPRRISPRVTGWLESELLAYVVSLQTPEVRS